MMEEERQRILEMLEDGKIDAAEVQSLLQALASGEMPPAEPETEVVETAPAAREEEPDPVVPPSMERFREFWRIPFFVSVGVLVLSGLLLGTAYATSGGRATVGFICSWTVFIIAGFAVLLAFWSRSARWLHLRVQEESGRRIAISLPLPLRLAQWAIGIAQRYVEPEVGEQLRIAREMLDAVQDEMRLPDAEPLIIEVDEGAGGERVRIYIG